MTFASVLATFNNLRMDAVLVMSGVPVLFGTRAGRVHDGTGVNAAPSTWTSVSAWNAKSLKQGESTIDKDGCMVKPSQMGLEIYRSTSWNRYFERRRLPQPVLTADITETDTTIPLNSTSGITSGDYLYVNRETIKVGTVASGTSLTGCTRNAIGLAADSAASHVYGTTCGLTPRHLLGRECALRIFIGSSDTVYQDFIGLKITASPHDVLERAVWELAFDDGMSRFARKISVGMVGAQVTGEPANDGTSLFYDFGYLDGTELAYANGNNAGVSSSDDQGHVMLSATGNNAGGALPVVSSFTLSGGNVRVPINAFASATNNVSPVTFNYARRVYAFQGSPMEAALKVLLSDRGNGTIHADYDVLAGPVSSTGGTTSNGRLTDATSERRLGAAIPLALIDVATLTQENLLTRIVPGWFYVLGARGPENLLDFLEEVGWALGGFWFINVDGKLSFKLFDAAYPNTSAVNSITEGQLARDVQYVSVDDEKEVLHSVSIEANVGLGDNRPHAFFSSVWIEGRETYRDVPGGTRTMTRKGLLVSVQDQDTRSLVAGGLQVQPASVDDVRVAMSRMYVYRMNGVRKYIFDCPYRYCTIVAGDIITVTHSKFNAFDGSGLSSAALRVTSRKPDFAKQRVQLTCEETWAGRLISPVARVKTWSGAGPYTLTLENASSKWNLGTSPTSYFAAGWTLEMRKYGTGATRYATSGTSLINSISSGTVMIVNDLPYSTPAAKDIVQFRDYANASSTVANTAQNLGQRSYAFMADDNFFLNSVDAAYVWG